MRYVGSEYDDDFDEDDEYEDDEEVDEEDDESPSPRVNPFTPSTGIGGQRSSTLPGAGRTTMGGTGSSSNLPGSRLPGSTGVNRPGSPSSPPSSSASPPRYGGQPQQGSSPPRTGGPTQGSSPSTQRPGSPSSPSTGGSSTPFASRYPSTTSPTSGSPTSSSTYPPRSGSSSPSTGSSSSGSYSGKPAASDKDKDKDKDKDAKSGGGLLGGLSGRLGRGGDSKPGDKPATPKGSSTSASSALGGLTSRFGNRGDTGGKPASPAKPADDKSSGVGGLFNRLRPGAKADDKKDDKRSTGTSSTYKPPGSSPYSSSSQSASSYGGKSSTSTSSAVRSTGETKKPLFGNAGGASASSSAKPAKAEAQSGGLGRFLPFGRGGAKDEKKPAPKPRTSKAPKIEGEGLSLDSKLDILGVALVLGSLALFLSRLSSTKGQLTEWVNTLLTQTFGWGAIAVPVAMMAVGIWLIARHFGDEAPVIPSTRLFGIGLVYVGVLILMQYIDTYSYVNSDGSVVTMAALQAVWLPISIARGSGGGWIGANLYYILASNITEYGAFMAAAFLLVVGTMFILSISAAELTMIVISVGRSFTDARQRRAQRRAQTAAPGLEQLTAEVAAPAISVSRPEPEALPAAASAPALPAASEPALPAGSPILAPQRQININIGGRSSVSPSEGELQPVENKPFRPGQQPAASVAAKPGEAPATSGGFGSRLRGVLPGGKPATAPETAAQKPAAPASTAPASAGGGFGSRLRSAIPTSLPGGKSTSDIPQPAKAEAAPADKPATPMGTLRGMFNRQSSETKSPETSAAAVPEKSAAPANGKPLVGTPATASTAPAMPAASGVPASASSAPFSKPAAEEAPARLGDLMRPNTPRPPAPTQQPAASAASADSRSSGDSPAVLKGSVISPTGTPTAAPTSRLPEAPKPPSPFSKPASAFKPEDLLDDNDEDFDDDFDDDMDDMDDEEDDRLTNLAPAAPKGTGPLPRPESRFAPTTFNKTADSAAPADRMDRLNAIRSGTIAPPPVSPSKPDESGVRRDVPQQPAASAQSVTRPPVTPANGGTPAAPPARPTVQPFGTPAAPAAAPSSPADGDKKPQPAAAFWKKDDAPPKAPETPKSSDLPKPEVKPPAPSYGKPPTPPGVPVNETTAPAAFAAANAALPPSPEIALRQPGVGTTAPSGGKRRKEWKLPSYAQLLMAGSENDIDRESLLRRARIIEDTLNSFGAPGKVVEVNTGPVITQFGVEPDYLVTRGGKKNRVKVGAIAQLDKDLQLALGAKSIRIEAPVPGKGYVGIEVPNDVPSLVGLRDVMESDNFRKIKSPLAIALGQSVDGAPISADLTGMPHLLIAGTTGSGKSVCVNAIITSLIIQNTPDKVKFIMVDPKRVELTGYNGIPHLVAPVVVDLERIVGVLKWVTREMDERYKKFSTAGARNIDDYNNHLQNEADWMPYIVVIIDELADLMMLAPDETERVITRIAALARATGIHLVIATQRPSVDVVTGLIKANFPARIAFAVAGGVDSRVILDQPGAERLLGRGDMLYMSGDSPAPLRLQGVYVSDTEINNITRYWKGQMGDDDGTAKPISTLVLDHSIAESGRSVMPSNEKQEIQAAFWDKDEKNSSSNSSVSSTPGSNDDDDSDDQEDDLYEEAVEMVRRLNKASVSLLQRRLRIGYTRAARLIDRMEEEKIIGPAVEGSRPREVIQKIGN